MCAPHARKAVPESHRTFVARGAARNAAAEAAAERLLAEEALQVLYLPLILHPHSSSSTSSQIAVHGRAPSTAPASSTFSNLPQVARRRLKKDLGSRRRDTKAFAHGGSSLNMQTPSVMTSGGNPGHAMNAPSVSAPLAVAETSGGSSSRDAGFVGFFSKVSGSERCNVREEDARLCSSERMGGEATRTETSAAKSMSSFNALALPSSVEQSRRDQSRNSAEASPVPSKAHATSVVAHAKLERKPMPPVYSRPAASIARTPIAAPLEVSKEAGGVILNQLVLIGPAAAVKRVTSFGRGPSGGDEAKVAAGLAAAIAAADGTKSDTKSRLQRGGAAAEQRDGSADSAASPNAVTHAGRGASRGGVAAAALLSVACGPAPAVASAKKGTVEAIDAVTVEDQVPISFYCPITQEIMADPVFTSDGQTYERAAIEKWLANHNTSPLTGNQLSINTLTPNVLARGMIREFLEGHREHTPKSIANKTYLGLPAAAAAVPTQGGGVSLGLSFDLSSNRTYPLSNLLAAGPRTQSTGPIGASPAAASPLLGAIAPAGGRSGSGLPPPKQAQAAAGVIGPPGSVGRAPGPCTSVGSPSPRPPNQALPGLGVFGPAALSASASLDGPLTRVVPSADALTPLSLPGRSPGGLPVPVNISPPVGRAPGPIGRAPGPVSGAVGKGLVGPGALGSGAPFGSSVLGGGLCATHPAPAVTGAVGWAGKAATPIAAATGLPPPRGSAAGAGVPSVSLNGASAGGHGGNGKGVGSTTASPVPRTGRTTRGTGRNRRGGA